MLNRLAAIAALVPLALAAPAVAQDPPVSIELAQKAVDQAVNRGGQLLNWSFPSGAKKPEWNLARGIVRAETPERCVTVLTVSKPTRNENYPGPITAQYRIDWAQVTEVSEPSEDRVHFRTATMARGESATIVFSDTRVIAAMSEHFLYLANSCAAIRR